jgi:ABC-2 type transport system permease protein
MRVQLTLLRKQLLESRWVLGLMCAALSVLAFLWTWRVAWAVKRIEEGAMGMGAGGGMGGGGPQARGMGMFRAFGGPEMDFSAQAMAAAVWNHPVVLLMILGWAISRSSAAVAAEVERGTLDLTLCRPVRRSSYLSSQVVFGVLGVLALAFAVIAGQLAAWRYYHIPTSPVWMGLVRPAAMYAALGIAVYGYTLPFSAIDSIRWRSSVAGVAITLGGLICMILARQLDGYDWLEKLSVFRAYAPVTVAMKGDPLAYNGGVLAAVFGIGIALATPVFLYRDLPANA